MARKCTDKERSSVAQLPYTHKSNKVFSGYFYLAPVMHPS